MGGDIFSIFQVQDQEVYQDQGVSPFDDDYTNLGTVITGVENYLILDQMYCFKYPEKYGEVRHSIRKTYLDKLFTFLTKVSLDNSQMVEDFLHEFTISRIAKSLTFLLTFYEKVENYENCIIIKKFLDKFLREKLHAYQ